MARVLFAWELGGNLGHVAQLLPVANELRALGHEPLFALSDVTRAEAALGPFGFGYLQAPVWRSRAARAAPAPCSYAEILQHYGYLDRAGLLGMVKGWREIYRHVAPDAVVFDHAPTALLAARGLDATRVMYGVGFCSPPRVQPLPNFRTWEEVPRARLEASEAQVLDTVNAVLAKLQLRPLVALHELFDADEEFLCTFAELDHYAARPHCRYCGPVFSREEGDEAEWPDTGGKRVYVYLRPEMPAFNAVAEALSDCGASVLWVAPNLSDARARRYAKHALKFVRRPVRLAAVAAHADAAVLYGGHGTVAAMLLAGIPMALYPTHVEQALVTRSAMRIGAAVGAPTHGDTAELRKPLEALLRDTRLQESARAFAEKYRGHDPRQVAARAANTIHAYCSQPERALQAPSEASEA